MSKMEARPPVKAKKLCNRVHVVFFMVQKGVSKTKIVFDLHYLVQRGKILGRSLNELMIRHHTALSCRSFDDVDDAIVSTNDYEFSCSNSPAGEKQYIPYHVSKRNKAHYPYTHCKHHAHNVRRSHAPPGCVDVAAVVGEHAIEEESPLVGPVIRRVRITDSPFPPEDADKDCHVDKAAEEFIAKFYKQLRLQKSTAGREAEFG